MHASPYCYFHTDLNRRRREVPLPMLQTAADIQLAITEVIRALIEGRIDRGRANSILYGLQLSQNGLSIGNFPKVKFTGDLEDINPAERSLVIPAIDTRQSVEEFEGLQDDADLLTSMTEHPEVFHGRMQDYDAPAAANASDDSDSTAAAGASASSDSANFSRTNDSDSAFTPKPPQSDQASIGERELETTKRSG
jgi:hypothetical protein